MEVRSARSPATSLLLLLCALATALPAGREPGLRSGRCSCSGAVGSRR